MIFIFETHIIIITLRERQPDFQKFSEGIFDVDSTSNRRRKSVENVIFRRSSKSRRNIDGRRRIDVDISTFFVFVFVFVFLRRKKVEKALNIHVELTLKFLLCPLGFVLLMLKLPLFKHLKKTTGGSKRHKEIHKTQPHPAYSDFSLHIEIRVANITLFFKGPYETTMDSKQSG